MKSLHGKVKSLTLTPLLFAFLLLFLMASNALAATLTVCATGATYTTIQAGITAASAGDTISICDGVYNENNINITQNNLSIEGTSGIRDNVLIQDNTIEPIFNITNYISNFTLKNLSINQQRNNQKAIYINSGGSAYLFENLNIKSKGYAFYQENGNLQNSSFVNVDLSASGYSLHSNTPEGLVLVDVNLTSTGSSCFHVNSPGGPISITKLNQAYNVFTCQDNGVVLGNTSQNYTINSTKITTTNNNAVSITASKINVLTIDDVKLDSSNQGSGVWVNGDVNTVSIKNSIFSNIRSEAIYFSKLNGTGSLFEGNTINSGSYGVRLSDFSNPITIKNNIIQNATSYGILLLDSSKWRSSQIMNNCFISNATNAYSLDQDARFDDGSSGNYWDNWSGSGSYIIPNIPKYDAHPLSQCPLVVISLPIPIANYRFDECVWNETAGEVKDSSGSNYNGTFKKKTMELGGGIINKAPTEFNDDSYVELLGFPDFASSFTITSWFKSMDVSVAGQRVFADDQINNGGYAISLGDAGSAKLRFYDRSQSGSGIIDSDAVVQNDTWYFVAAVTDITNARRYLYIYDINGNLINSKNTSMNNRTPSRNNGIASIGGEPDGGETVNRFKGSIDEVKIFDRALNLSQIQSIVTNEKDGKNYDGTERLASNCLDFSVEYRFDDSCTWAGSGYNIIDDSGSGALDGKAVNGPLKAVQGKICSGAEFNVEGYETKKDDQYIMVDDSDRLDNITALTAMAWIYPTMLEQDNGTNARGIFSKRTSANSDNAYGVFFLNGSGVDENHDGSYDKAKLYVDIVDTNNRFNSNSYIYKNRWTHVAIVFDGSLAQNQRAKVYINGVLDKTASESSTSIPDLNSNFYIGNLYYGASQLKVFKGKMDEIKITKEPLSAEKIKSIYDNEVAGNDYLGRLRDCSCTFDSYEFDAWDTFRSINDRNISTKIAAQDFDITIGTKDGADFNGTVCAQVWNMNDSINLTAWNKLLFTGANLKTAIFNSNYASKDSKIALKWKKNQDVACESMVEDNRTKSSDNFAIRPKEFKISNATTAYAGDAFKLDFQALSNLNSNSLDYNETKNGSFQIASTIAKSGCSNGVLNVGDFSFINGEKLSVDANFSDVGDVNITISEKPGFEFAKVDNKANDTTDSAVRLITPKSYVVTVLPYELNITDANFTASTAKSWLYDANVSDIYVTASAMVQANNKQHVALQNFTESCYAQPVDLTFYYDLNNTNNNVNLSYLMTNGTMASASKSVSDINKTITLPASLFTTPRASANYRFNVDRAYNVPLSPIDMALKQVKVTSIAVAKDENNATVNKVQKFYYGRITTKDITTNKKDVNHTAKIEVYDSNHALEFKQNSINWYEMEKDNNTSVKFIDKKTFQFDEDNTTIIVNQTKIENGIITLNINNSGEIDNAYIHLKIPPYLWYNTYSDYNDTNDSDCGGHPCFRYIYNSSGAKNSVSSGDFNGSTIGNDYNSTYEKVGVKTFR